MKTRQQYTELFLTTNPETKHFSVFPVVQKQVIFVPPALKSQCFGNKLSFMSDFLRLQVI